MASKLTEVFSKLANRDIEALRSIYNFKCLSMEQIYQLHYKSQEEDISKSYCEKKIQDLEEMGVIKKVNGIDKSAYFLTSLGIDVVKTAYDFPANIYDVKTKVVKRGYYKASELMLSPRLIPHQLALNQFMVDFISRDYNLYWKYYDEKHISQFNNIRPDGLLHLLNTDYFIELDMATESKNQLYEKWENYRRFLESLEFSYIERKIVVLFIVENTANPKARIDLIKHTISERLLDQLNANFEIYVNTKEEILNLLDHRINTVKKNKIDDIDEIFRTLARQGFTISFGEHLRKVLTDDDFDFYCRKIDENNLLVVENNKVQEYLIDSYLFSPMSVLKKIAYMHLINLKFKNKFNRDITYIIVAESEEKLFSDLKITDSIVVNNVFFTTFERLKTKPFHQALFQFDFLGNIYGFVDRGLNDREFERNIFDEAITSVSTNVVENVDVVENEEN